MWSSFKKQWGLWVYLTTKCFYQVIFFPMCDVKTCDIVFRCACLSPVLLMLSHWYMAHTDRAYGSPHGAGASINFSYTCALLLWSQNTVSAVGSVTWEQFGHIGAFLQFIWINALASLKVMQLFVIKAALRLHEGSVTMEGKDIDTAAKQLATTVQPWLSHTGKVHCVFHSLGGMPEGNTM